MTEQRKTLADIRRELDAEFPPLEDDTRADDDEKGFDEKTLEELRLPPRRQERRLQLRRPHLKAALFCALVLEVFVLGYMVGRVYRDEPVVAVPSARPAAARVPQAASVTSAPAAAAVTHEVPARVIAVEPESSLDRNVPGTVAAESVARVTAPERDVTSNVPAHAAPATVATVRDPIPAPEASLVTSDARRVKADAKALTPDATRLPPDAGRVTSDAGRVTAEAQRVRPENKRAVPEPRRVTPDSKLVTLALPGPGDWVESQSQLRAALREWLRLSGYAGPSSDSEDAEVVLGADGQTAKTRVPVSVGNHVIIREQRWRRDARGWNIVEESQVQSPRPR